MPQGPVEETGGVGGHTRKPVAVIKSQICVSFDLAVHSPQTACGGHGQECPLGESAVIGKNRTAKMHNSLGWLRLFCSGFPENDLERF